MNSKNKRFRRISTIKVESPKNAIPKRNSFFAFGFFLFIFFVLYLSIKDFDMPKSSSIENINKVDAEPHIKQRLKIEDNNNNIDSYESIDGTYSYYDNSARLKITISGNFWSGITMMVTGFGSDNDNQNAQYDNGIVKGNDLYESSGMVKVGHINGNSLNTSVGGQSVTLWKS